MRFEDLPPPLRRAVHRHWGSMEAARRAARLPARRRGRAPTWSPERVIDEIRKLARRGQHMSANALMEAGRFDLLAAAASHFGSLALARERAGIVFIRRRAVASKAWDADAVVNAILERYHDGETLAVTKSPRSLVSAATRHFPSWRVAIETAGLNYDDIILHRHYSDDDLLTWLRQTAEAHSQMTLFDMDKYGGHTVACRRRWGSLEEAAAAAGLNDWPVRTRFEAMSCDEIVRTLRRLSRARVPLSFTRVREDPSHQRLLNSVMKRFASWDEAIAAAGLPPQRLAREPWTKESVIEELRKWHRAKGARRGNLQRDVPGLYGATRLLFGSYKKALQVAGLGQVHR